MGLQKEAAVPGSELTQLAEQISTAHLLSPSLLCLEKPQRSSFPSRSPAVLRMLVLSAPIAFTLGGFPGCWALSKPFGYIYSLIIAANLQGGDFGFSFRLLSLRMWPATYPTRSHCGMGNTRVGRVTIEKSGGCSHSGPPPGGTLDSQHRPASLSQLLPTCPQKRLI